MPCAPRRCSRRRERRTCFGCWRSYVCRVHGAVLAPWEKCSFPGCRGSRVVLWAQARKAALDWLFRVSLIRNSRRLTSREKLARLAELRREANRQEFFLWL